MGAIFLMLVLLVLIVAAWLLDNLLWIIGLIVLFALIILGIKVAKN